jgi:exodeoxyribonuclease VII small subunit
VAASSAASPRPADATAAPTRAGAPGAAPDDDVATLGYERARDELISVVARLEAGAGSLEESLELWERGERLAARCQQWLDGARERLDAARAQSHPTPAPQDDEETDR